MRLAVTGGTGLVGHFLVEAALAARDRVTLLSRRPPPSGHFSAPVAHLPWRLGDAPDLAGQDALVHAALAHMPGRYRGGEGNDPEGFLRANRGGTARLFRAAETAGIGRVIFLSSRAAYGPHPPGTPLREAMPAHPDTLYGSVKLAGEAELFTRSGLAGTAIRATGIYGPPPPGAAHKWAELFADFHAGRPIAPRAGTELHGADLAAAIRLLLTAPPRCVAGRVFNASDLRLDRRDLLAEVARLTGCTTPLPARAEAHAVNAMDCARLRSLGWRAGGWARLRETLPDLLGGDQTAR